VVVVFGQGQCHEETVFSVFHIIDTLCVHLPSINILLYSAVSVSTQCLYVLNEYP